MSRDGSAKMIYTVMSADSSDTVQVEDGVLVSGSNSGQAALQLTAQEEFGINQTLVLLVKVTHSLVQLTEWPSLGN